MRRTAGYTRTDCKTNTQTAKELKITPILDKLLEYKRNWTQHVNRMPCNRLPRVMKHYSPTGRRNHGTPLKRLLDTRDWNGSKSGPTPWQIYDDDEEFVGGDSSTNAVHSSHSESCLMKKQPGTPVGLHRATLLYQTVEALRFTAGHKSITLNTGIKWK